MQLISKFNKGFRFLLCVIYIFSRYARVVPLKDEKGASIVNAFQKVLDKSKRKPNNIWVDKGSEFYNSSFKTWLKDNDIEMYSTYNEGKSVVAERFISTLTQYSPVLLSYTHWKHQKTLGFLMFSGRIEKQHRAVMG